MASTSSAKSPKAAPWKSKFLEDINKLESPEFVFSTLAAAPKGSSTPYVPRARYCIFRGFWAELPENKHNDAPKNPQVYESDMPTLCTDVRMLKVPQIFGSSAGHAEKEEQWQGSGGGGPCEAVWWVKDTMMQWRVKGEAFVIGNDIEGEGSQTAESSGVRTVKSELGSRMRVINEAEKDKWSWATELTGHFGNVSPTLKGSFKYPPPGQKTSEPYDDKNLKPGAKADGLHDPIARKNFRMIVIKPEQVESVDLSDPNTNKRQLYTYVESSGEWEQDELWP